MKDKNKIFCREICHANCRNKFRKKSSLQKFFKPDCLLIFFSPVNTNTKRSMVTTVAMIGGDRIKKMN